MASWGTILLFRFFILQNTPQLHEYQFAVKKWHILASIVYVEEL